MLTQAEPITKLVRRELKRINATRTLVKVEDEGEEGTLGVTDYFAVAGQSRPFFHVIIYPGAIAKYVASVYPDVLLHGLENSVHLDDLPTVNELYTAELLDTIKHEVAHVAHINAVHDAVGASRLPYVLYGDDCYHGVHWKRWARVLGARPFAHKAPRHTMALKVA